MSYSIELAEPRQCEQPTDLEDHSRFYELVARVKQAMGRVALVAGLAMGPTIAVEHTEAIAATVNENNYPNNDAICVAGDPQDPNSSFGKVNGTGYWCPGYQWGYVTRNNQGAITGNTQNSSRGYGYRNCTDWAAFRARELTGKAVPANLGNANTWDTNAPSSWDRDGTPEPGDIAQTDAGSLGHLGVVEEVGKDGSGKITSIKVSAYNSAQDGKYSEETDKSDTNGIFWRPNGAKWGTFLDLNGPGVGINGEATANASPQNNTVIRVEKRNQSDGVNLVYWAKAGSVFESWWRPNGDGVHISDLIDVSQQDVKDIDVQLKPDGEHLLYTATSHYIWETYWYPGKGRHTAPIIQDAGNIRKIEKTVGPDGKEQLYVMTDEGVDEYWWSPNGEIHKSRIYTLANPVAMKKEIGPDGTQELYVADQGYVYRNWWQDDSVVHRGEQVMHIAQADITDIDVSEDPDGKRHVYAGRRRDGVWEASWYPGQAPQTWQVTGDNGVVAIEKYMDGNMPVLYVATSGGIFEYWWSPGTTNVAGSVITAQADVHDFDRATTGDGAQAVYTAANTRVFESYWFPGGKGVTTKPIA